MQIDLSYLQKRYGLSENRHIQTSLHWTRGGQPAGQIGITIDTCEMYVELDYRYNNEPRNYRVPLIAVPSNLGIGQVLFFVCPATGRHCRKLHQVGGWFLHRTAFKGCLYQKQTYSKAERAFDAILAYDDFGLFDELRKCKKSYRGKPTRRHTKLLRHLERSERQYAAAAHLWRHRLK